MPTTKKKSAKPKPAGLERRVKVNEAKIEEIEKKLTAGLDRIEMIKSAVAEGRLDKL